eukprot:GHVT01064939.1.p1 GENE.GHVT01064939.1~~GHVT01064939.1.p1  ORF type:complete len:106 (-),score=4.45 GHVT01064939.1:907-1224(-)
MPRLLTKEELLLLYDKRTANAWETEATCGRADWFAISRGLRVLSRWEMNGRGIFCSMFQKACRRPGLFFRLTGTGLWFRWSVRHAFRSGIAGRLAESATYQSVYL